MINLLRRLRRLVYDRDIADDSSCSSFEVKGHAAIATFEDKVAMNIEKVSPPNPIKIYPDGDMWCAYIGSDLVEGITAFDCTPELAFAKLLQDEQAQLLIIFNDSALNCNPA